MLERFLPVLIVAITGWCSLVSSGNAQALPGRRPPMNPQGGGSQGFGPAAVPTVGALPAAGGYGAPMPGYGAAAAEPATFVMDPNRKLQAGDQLSFRIDQDREAAVLIPISQTGDLTIDPFPQSFHVAGLTIAQAASELKRELEKDYYYAATVRLNLERATATFAGQVTLSGEVNRVGPLNLNADRPLKVSGAILMMGGFKQFANQRKVNVTRMSREGKAERFIVDVKAVLDEGKVDRDRLLQDGDQIFVPQNFFQP